MHPQPILRTTFLAADIHCASCTSFIEATLFALDPPPIAVETSIVTHSVTVDHDATLSVSIIAHAIAEAGYEIDNIIPHSPPDKASPIDLRDEGGAELPFEDTDQSVTLRRRSAQAAEDETKRRRHMEHCEQCRAESRDATSQATDWSRSSLEKPTIQTAVDPFVVVAPPSTAVKVSHATISVSGMSCSACVGKITEALEHEPWVRFANIALLTQSAVVEYEGEHDAKDLTTIIEDIGYEASVEKVVQLPPVAAAAPRAAVDVWKASLSIEGMTCSACVSTINDALSTSAWMKSVDVNLITNSATVVFEDKVHLDDILLAIDDIGYGVKLNDIKPLGKDQDQDNRRTVLLRIDGMYCEHCPARVAEALEHLSQPVSIEQSPTMSKPILSISYTPNAPEFTIRDILTAISAADLALEVAVYHPPSITERAAQMHARIRQRILYRVVLAVVVAIPTFIIGIVFMSLVPSSNPGRRYLAQKLRGVTRAEWALLIMATPIYFFGADVFHRRTIKELQSLWGRRSPVPVLRRFYRFGSMDMLLSFGTTIAYVSSIVDLVIKSTSPASTSMTGDSTYFDSVVFLTMFLLIGRLIEAYSRAKTGEAVTTLSKLRPKEALLVSPKERSQEGSGTQSVNVDLIDSGDVVRVVHGGSPPWDGTLLEGEGEFDESSLTGESRPVKKTTGDPIYAGASGRSMLDQIIEAVQEGQARRAPIERVADVLTSYFVPVVTLIAIVTWLTWLSLGLSGALPISYLDVAVGGWSFWSLQFAIAVFVIACPCGIGLAAPTALFVGGGLAAQHGILVKGGGEAFQEASGLDIIVFDKTGTLTQGSEPTITDHQILTVGDALWDEQAVFGVLGALEQDSSHPLGKAIVGLCKSKDISGLDAKSVEEIAGKGMKGSFDMAKSSRTVEVLVGNEALMADYGIAFDSTACSTLDSWKTQAKSVVLVAARELPEGSWTPLAILAATDPLRPEARDVVEAITRQGIQVWMLSGDNPTTASAVGASVGIPPSRIIGGVLPQQKADKIKYLQTSQPPSSHPHPHRHFLNLFRSRTQPAKRRTRAIVAMLGDGINDSPALAAADVSIAIGSGSDIAISASSFVLVNSDLRTLLTLIRLSRAVFQRVKFNFAWALVYNLAALPIAAGVLYPVRIAGGGHVRLDPVWASLAMALSSSSVVCSSLLLRSRLPFVGFRESGKR
ncbi:hypothetical protein LTS09_002529 [Friedmanniomyces endolithicus]|nr:hypothetical protein LTS09_002529 [Friedmanniomyces endolithicus]